MSERTFRDEIFRTEIAEFGREYERTPEEWCTYFKATVIDPDGWRGQQYRSMDEPITAAEFARRWAVSTCMQPPSPRLELLLRWIGS